MSNHVIDLLGAYMDGELQGKQQDKVEVHLAECQVCQEEYAALQALSRMLHEVPVPDFPLPERLAAEAALRLPRKPAVPIRRKALEIGWWMVPVGLIGIWIFISTVLLVSNMLEAANTFGLLNSASEWLVAGSPDAANFSATIGSFGFLKPETLQWFTLSEWITRDVIGNIFWQVAIGMFYLSWLAIWWARHTHQELRGSLESGSKPKLS